MVPPPAPTPVLSRLVFVDDISDDGLHVRVAATSAERTDLARLNGLVEVRALDGSFLLRREPHGGVWVTGEVVADIVQTCVVLLDPFDARVREVVDLHFLPEHSLDIYRAARAKRVPVADDEVEEDEPDLIEQGRIDVGGLTAEYLTLGLDPYPQKPGVKFEDVAPHPAEPAVSPFAVLKTLRTDES